MTQVYDEEIIKRHLRNDMLTELSNIEVDMTLNTQSPEVEYMPLAQVIPDHLKDAAHRIINYCTTNPSLHDRGPIVIHHLIDRIGHLIDESLQRAQPQEGYNSNLLTTVIDHTVKRMLNEKDINNHHIHAYAGLISDIKNPLTIEGELHVHEDLLPYNASTPFGVYEEAPRMLGQMYDRVEERRTDFFKNKTGENTDNGVQEKLEILKTFKDDLLDMIEADRQRQPDPKYAQTTDLDMSVQGYGFMYLRAIDLACHEAISPQALKQQLNVGSTALEEMYEHYKLDDKSRQATFGPESVIRPIRYLDGAYVDHRHISEVNNKGLARLH